MDINRLQEEMIHGMEKEIQYKNEVIQAQKGQIRHLNNQISILEEQNKKLAEAGNQLSQKCADLDDICMCQQELLEEFSRILSDNPSGT